LGDADYKGDVEARGEAGEAPPKAWHIATTLVFCLSKIVGKYAAYPEVDQATFENMNSALTRGLIHNKTASALGDFCQELRSVTNCPVKELLAPRGADDNDIRLSAIAHVVRRYAELDEATFRELLTALLSWSPADKALIRKAVVSVIRG
jgi:hypothetical protein